MNILAHLYLSGSSENILIGNFIGDMVKGKKYLVYDEEIQKGILMHRDIDFFTDNHSITINSKKLLREKYHKYSGVVMDIFYDHFLSKSWNNFSLIKKDIFISRAYKILLEKINIIPISAQFYLIRMINYNWLQYYSKIEGVKVVLQRMSKKGYLPSESDFGINCLINNYNQLEADFNIFFDSITDYVSKKYDINFF